MYSTTKHITPLGNYDVPSGWPMKPYKRPYGGTPGPPVMYEKPSDPEDEGAGYGYSNAEGLEENDIYFYHSDHLGSTSYITDKDGNATQFVSYKPYGEALVDEHATSFESPWKFNGKELDSETGLYYYGARYYEPVLALWYGVDALAENLSSYSPYVYCYDNPIKVVDHDGNIGIIGAIVGAASDYAIQVTCNVIEKGWSTESFTDVDVKSILISGAAGAVGAGLSSIATKAAKVTRIAKGVTEASTTGKAITGAYHIGADVASSAIGQTMQSGEIDENSLMIDVVAGSVGRKISSKIGANREAQQKILNRTADRESRIAGGNPRVSRMERSSKAQKAATDFSKKTQSSAAISGAVGSNVISKMTPQILDKVNGNDN